MRAVSLVMAFTLLGSPVLAQEQTPIRASADRAVAAETNKAAAVEKTPSSGQKSTLFWTGVAVTVAGATTSALGLTVFRTEDSSTGNAPKPTYQNCVALRDSNPVYAGSQCDALKAKNLGLLWGGVAVAGAGVAMIIGGMNTSAQLSGGSIGLFHRVRF